MLVEAWRKRNQKWAAQQLTPAKYELIQRRWNRISRFSLWSFSLLAGAAFALAYELCFFVFDFFSGNIQRGASVFGKGFIFPLYVSHILPMTLLMGIVVAAAYYCCMREYAKLQPGKAA